jgi:hypothetical protein
MPSHVPTEVLRASQTPETRRRSPPVVCRCWGLVLDHGTPGLRNASGCVSGEQSERQPSEATTRSPFCRRTWKHEIAVEERETRTQSGVRVATRERRSCTWQIGCKASVFAVHLLACSLSLSPLSRSLQYSSVHIYIYTHGTHDTHTHLLPLIHSHTNHIHIRRSVEWGERRCSLTQSHQSEISKK